LAALSSSLFVDNGILLLLSKFIIIKKKLEYQTFQKKCLITHLPAGRQGLRIDYTDIKCLKHKESLSNHFFEICVIKRAVSSQKFLMTKKIKLVNLSQKEKEP
jgi:hypothetical protein